MYSKKYRIDKIEEFNGHNPIYDDMEGRICYPAYLNPGERGWLLCETDSYSGAVPHRWHTSIVEGVGYGEDTIILRTENTRITLTVC